MGTEKTKGKKRKMREVLGKNHGISAIFRIVKEQQTSCPIMRGLSKGMVNYVNAS